MTRVDAKPSGNAANGAPRPEPGGSPDEPPRKAESGELGAAWLFVRGLPRVTKAAIRTNPLMVVAGVGATAFVLGAVCGSKVGRVFVRTLAGYGLRRFIEGPVAREIARYAADAVKQAGAAA